MLGIEEDLVRETDGASCPGRWAGEPAAESYRMNGYQYSHVALGRASHQEVPWEDSVALQSETASQSHQEG